MAAESEFVGFVVESLRSLGPVSARRMFGGHGIFMDGLMFGLIADDQLYLKVDEGNRAAYEAEGLQPFTYDGKGRRIVMSYREAPSEGFDDPEILCDWAREAYAAALRSEAGKTKRGVGQRAAARAMASGSAKAST
jgi:DNA transformation protein and related proteins